MTERGLFTDFDGTLADTVPIAKSTFYDFLAARGVEEMPAFEQFNGPPLTKILEMVSGWYGWSDDPSALLAEYQGLLAANYVAAEAQDGASELLAAARDAGWKIAVVTSGSRKLVDRWLSRLDLRDAVSLIIGHEDVTTGKPDPEPYLLAVERTGCDAGQSVAIEDSRQGATSAMGAGLRTFTLGVDVDGATTIASLRELFDVFE